MLDGTEERTTKPVRAYGVYASAIDAMRCVAWSAREEGGKGGNGTKQKMCEVVPTCDDVLYECMSSPSDRPIQKLVMPCMFEHAHKHSHRLFL